MGTLRNDIDGLGDAPFRVGDGRSTGLTAWELRSKRFVAPYYGVRVDRPPATTLERCLAYAPRLRAEQAFSEQTAAELWGLPVPWRLRGRTDLDILVPEERYPPVAKGVSGRRIRRRLWHAVELRGMPVTPPELALMLLARRATVAELVVIGESLVTAADNYPGLLLPVRPALGVAQLRACVSGFGGGEGASRLRAMSDLIREGVESPMETVLRLTLLDAGLPEPEINGEVRHDGVLVARCDLLYRAARVALEYEGDQHRSDVSVFRGDIARIRRLEAAGWRVIRVTVDDIRDARRMRELIAQIRAMLAAAA